MRQYDDVIMGCRESNAFIHLQSLITGYRVKPGMTASNNKNAKYKR